ncbi:MAG: hypothetical protein HS106_11635 [Ideonella sp.]|nr:hypothetical protein [Ideonella sp.]
MNLRNLRHWLSACAVLALLLAASSGATADVTRVYQWKAADGTPTISNVAPPPSIANYSVHEVDAPAPSAKDQAAAVDRLEQYRVALAQESVSPDEAVARAQARLSQARHQLQIGREPLPGERLHNTNGFSRLGPMYFERQAKLEAAVAAAEAQLNEAYRERSEALQ